ncbi:hypothetical protein V1281_004312 [Nitrobacteraceae bacterium AZCC 2161]
MQAWEYCSEVVKPGGRCFDALETLGPQGWEAWHIENLNDGWREIYFKRPVDPEVARRKEMTDSLAKALRGNDP